MENLTIGHSPDSDDAFLFYAIATKKIETEGLEFEHQLLDIDKLNQKALRGEFEITAISFHAYPQMQTKYAILPVGASVGEQTGPVVVAKRPMRVQELAGAKIAVPGALTTAYLLLRLCVKRLMFILTPFDQILDEVKNDQVDAGVLIHEGQLTYAEQGLYKVIDLGQWWHQSTGLPVPLGANVVKKSLGPVTMAKVARILRRSLDYAMAHRDDAIHYATNFGRGLDAKQIDQYIAMYVNQYALDLGETGRRAAEELLTRGFQAGIIPFRPQLEFVPLELAPV